MRRNAAVHRSVVIPLLALALSAAAPRFVQADIPEVERQALIDIYNSTGGDDWFDNGDWLGGPGSECIWNLVICDDDWNRVIGLPLGWNNLVGTIPPSIGDMTALDGLSLADNAITGSLPPEIGNLGELRFLRLNNTQLTGPIPNDVHRLHKLEELYANDCAFTGPVPDGVWGLTALRILHLENNQLSEPLPRNFGDMVSLEEAYLSNNQLAGPLPAELGYLTNAVKLYLDHNLITGRLPTTLGNLARLEELNLEDNQLSGPLPHQMGNLQKLYYLNLRNNQISGLIPPSFGSLGALATFWISHNELSGSITPDLGNLPSISSIDLSDNRLTGKIPYEIGNLTTLSSLALNSNMLLGEIPASFANLTELRSGSLNLSWNGLHTHDPAVLALLTQKQPDWDKTQTIPPTNVQATLQSPTSVTITWDTIYYKGDQGGYRVLYTTTSGHNYIDAGITPTKWDTGLTVTGLSPATSYYFVVQTETFPHLNNRNTVVSERTPELLVITSIDPVVQRQALVDLYTSTNGAGWNRSSGWMGPEGTECNWYGITCGLDGITVTSIDLSANNLTGTLPASLSDMSGLRVLDLSSNNITGAIPLSLGNRPAGASLAVLESLDLGNNLLTDEIPSSIGNLANLNNLNLGGNHLTGNIPASFGNLRKLASLDLNGNELTGLIPSSLGSLTGLTNLYLQRNHLTESIPSQIGLLTNLRRLMVSSNALTGDIPDGLANLASLIDGGLDLRWNGLDTGNAGLAAFLDQKQIGGDWRSTQTVPPHGISAAAVSSTAITVSWTPIDFTAGPGGYRVGYSGVSGGPYVFSSWTADKTVTSLQVGGLAPGVYFFVVQSQSGPHPSNTNVVTSVVSSEVVGATQGWGPPQSQRQALIDFYNATDGPAWTSRSYWLGAPGTECLWYGVTCSGGDASVTRLTLPGNNLIGTLPAAIAGLPDLELLDVSSNLLSGPVPAFLSGLAHLERLRLQSNQLSGALPPALGSLPALRELDLASNELTGTIPDALGGLPQVQYLNLSDNHLEGEIPAALGGLSSLQRLYLASNQIAGEVPGALGSLTALLPGSGLDLRWEAVFTTDPALAAFLSAKQVGGDWQSSQTVAPENVTAAPTGQGIVTVSWTPIAFTAGPGGYRVSVSATPGGPYTPTGQTVDKTASSLPVTGLASETTFYFVVETVSEPHANNRNTLTSKPSVETSAETLPPTAERKALLELFGVTGGMAWSQSNGWNGPPGTECTWYGVTCDPSTFVIVGLDLHLNNLAGTLPASIANLVGLRSLDLHGNRIGGPIPPGIQRLTQLQLLNLGDNQLIGGIPPELGALGSLRELVLSGNHFSGEIPTSLGNLWNLQTLYLSSNKLTGGVPKTLMNIARLTSIDLRWNGLYTDDPALLAFLAQTHFAFGDWRKTQTIPPSDLTFTEVSESGITLDWAPIAYTDDSGGYKVWYARTSGGPYAFFKRTADKLASGTQVTGLSGGTTYYFVVEAETDRHGLNQNTVTSEPSTELAATTAGTAQAPPTEQVISLIANNNGQLGTRWMSNLMITNPYSRSIAVTLRATPEDRSESAGDPTITVDVQPGATLAIEDVYGALFGPQSRGKARLHLTTLDSASAPIGLPITTSNIYNALGDGGKMQTYGAPVRPDQLSGAGTTLGDNTVKGAGERYNFDVAAGPNGATIRYTYRNTMGTGIRTATETYKPLSTRQHVNAAELFGLSRMGTNSSITALIEKGDAYIRGTPTNNATGDSRSQPWQRFRDPDLEGGESGTTSAAMGSLDSGAIGEQIISLIVNNTGNQGSRWMSDIKITNPYSRAIMVTLQGTPHGESAGPADPTLTRVLQPGETLGIKDVYGALFGAEARGKARLRLSTTDLSGAPFECPIVTSNIYNDLGQGEEMQTFGAPITDADMLKAGMMAADNTVLGPGERYNFDVTTGPDGATIRYIYRDGEGGHQRSWTHSYPPDSTSQHVDAELVFGLRELGAGSSITAFIEAGSAYIRGTPTNNATSDSRSQNWQVVTGVGF